MNDIVLEASVVNVEPQTEVIVDAVSDAEAVVLDAVVRLENNEFVLSSGGMYGGGSLIGSIPAWVLEAVNQRLTTGDGNITGMVEDLQTALDALETGVNQSISNLEAVNLSQSGLITSLRSDVDGNNATIMNVLATKVTEAQASAVALTAIESKFGDDVEAFVSNIASTYVDADSAIATEIEMMQTSLNGVNASISDISSITIETVQNPLWVDDGLGTDPDINDEPRWIDQAKAKKQLEVNADGVITGLLLESGQTSSVTVQSDEFKLVATGQSVASRNPFTVNATTGQITFDGIVDFTNTNLSGTTSIDGGKITTGTINANRIDATTIAASNMLVDQTVRSSDFATIGGAGFRLKSNAAGTYADPTIYGAYIRGAYLSGSFADIASMKIAATGFPDNYGKSHYVATTYHSGTTYSTTTTLGTFLIYGPAYGSGLESKRVCDTAQTIIELSVTFARPNPGSYIDIQRSIDSGSYSTVATSSTGYNSPFTYYFIDSSLPSGFSTCQYRYTIYTGGGNVVLWTSRITIDNI